MCMDLVLVNPYPTPTYDVVQWSWLSSYIFFGIQKTVQRVKMLEKY